MAEKISASRMAELLERCRYALEEECRDSMSVRAAELLALLNEWEALRAALQNAYQYAYGYAHHNKDCPLGININAPDNVLCTCGMDERADVLMDEEEALGFDFWKNARAIHLDNTASPPLPGATT